MHYYNVDFRFCLNISGRLTSESWLDSSNNAVNTFTYQYDILGNLLSAFDGVSSSDYTYDTMNRIDSKIILFDAQMAVFSYTYDTLGRQTESSLRLNGVQDRTVNIEYDYLGRAISAELTGNALNDILAELDYNAVGALTDVRRFEWDDTDELYNLIAQSQYQYNARNQITSINHQDSNNNNIVSHGYLYDADGNISQYTNSLDGSVLYDYDFLGQLTGADYSNLDITDESYQYDLNGNRELVTNANGDLVVYSTGTNNELNSDGNYSYAYDAEGNRISKTNAAGTERELYEWDYRNRLSSVTKQTYDSVSETWQTVQIVEYAYDYNNVLIRKVLDADGDGISDSKTIFLPENYQVAVQLDDADLSDSTDATVSHRYLWTPGQQDKLLADVTPTETLWTLTDHLGTIRDMIQNTPSGLLVPAHVIYDAYGNVLSCKDANGTDIDNPVLFGFTGKYFDADTQLQNNVNRWYDATTGRWLSTDPIGFNGNDTNLYRYVGNKVLFELDKLGKVNNPCPCGEEFEQIKRVGFINAIRAKLLATQALEKTLDSKLGLTGTGWKDQKDAFRHCYWSCLMTFYLGKKVAKNIGDVHELCDSDSGNITLDNQMDLYNNSKGISYGAVAKSENDCLNNCLNAAKNGTLMNGLPKSMNQNNLLNSESEYYYNNSNYNNSNYNNSNYNNSNYNNSNYNNSNYNNYYLREGLKTYYLH